MNMKCDISRQRIDPVLAPDQFGVAQPLGPEDLDRCVTRHGIYPSFPAPTGVPWNEYLRLQRNRSWSVSSFTEVLDSDHVRYITSRIAQHARSMATGTRCLPTDSPVPYFQTIERGHVSEGIPGDIGLLEDVPHRGMQIPPCHANLGEIPYLPSGGIEHHPAVSEPDRLSTYTGLDIYDTLFEVRHGRGAIDNMPKTGEEAIATSSIGIPPVTLSVGMTENPMVSVIPRHTPDSGQLPPNEKEHVSAGAVPSIIGHRVVSPVSIGHILGEGAAIFTDMTETVLTALDQQMASLSEAQKPEVSLTDNAWTPGQIAGSSNIGEFKTRSQTANETKDIYPDLYLPVAENYKISNRFYGYTDSMSTDNNLMVLVELTGLSYRYGTIIYAVHRVNGTMYGKFSVGYRVINERATVRPQFRPASLEGEYVSVHPTYANTLPGTTSMVTPLAKSTPITQSLQMPTISAALPHVKDILEPTSNKQVRSAYLERQMKEMDSVKLPSDIPSLKNGMILRPESLQTRYKVFVKKEKVKESRNGDLIG